MGSYDLTTYHSEVWQAIRVRYLVFAFVLPLFFVPGGGFVTSSLGPDAPPYAFDLAIILYIQTIWCLVVYVTSTLPVEVPFREMLGRAPSKIEILGGLKFSAWIFLAATGTAYLLFLPLSYWAPTFVTYWFIELPDLVYFHNNSYPVLPNLLNLLSLCVIAPLLEEFAFRGLLLHRWAHKYGLKSAVIWSSVLFGVLHPDPIAAFIFGVCMCILYLRSQSILLPIICHSIYNFVVWLVEIGYILVDGPEFEYTLAQFQNEWPYGAIAMAIALAWAVIHLRKNSRDVSWRLPAS